MAEGQSKCIIFSSARLDHMAAGAASFQKSKSLTYVAIEAVIVFN